MNVIERAIEQGMNLTSNERLKNQTWKQFETILEKKQIWIFGVGKAAGLFWEKYSFSLPVTGVIDNDPRKQGRALKYYVGITKDRPDGELIIQDIDVMRNICSDEIVVVVSSVRYYEEIFMQLEAMGIKNVFVMVIMEANEPEEARQAYMGAKVFEMSKEEIYAEECLKYPVERRKILIFAGIHGSHEKQIGRQLASIKMVSGSDLDIVWVLENPDTKLPEGIRCVWAGNWKEYIRELETAYIWIYGEEIPLFARKRPEQIYIQTKHWAGVTLKTFGWDSEKHVALSGVKQIYRHNSQALDYIFVGSRFDEESCRSGFCFDGECVYVGSPRTDILFCPGMKEKVCSYYGINLNTHILLYSPTFRAAGGASVMARMRDVDLDFERVEKALKKKFGGEWVILFRAHPAVAVESLNVFKPEFVKDASYYEECQELVAAADITITDYSSIMFEPAFIGRPVFLYAPDKKEYVGKERELLLDYDSLPFSISESNAELVEEIAEFDMESYGVRVKEFLDFYGVHEDGHASERAAEFILKRLLGQKYE